MRARRAWRRFVFDRISRSRWFVPLRGLLRPIRRVIELIPLTLLGLLVSLGGAVTWYTMGAERMDQVLTVVAEVALGLTVLSVLSVVIATLRLRRSVRDARSEAVGWVEADRPAVTGMSAPSLRFTPLVQVGWEWDEPGDVEVTQNPSGARLLEQVVPRRRGYHEQVRRRFVVRDSLGLSRLVFRKTESLSPPLRVLPNRGGLRQASVISTLAGGEDLPHPLGTMEGDRLELRRYGPGDPARLIVWKIFARRRALVVRTPERALARAHSVAAYLIAGDGDEPPAAAARVAIETGALGTQWVFGADGVGQDAHREAEALDVVMASARHGEVRDGAGLAHFIRRNERHGTVRYLLFAPARGGPWVERVAALASRRRGMIDVVIVGDGIGRRPTGGWRRLLWRFEDEGGVSPETLTEVVTRLASRGVEVTVVDRPSGQVVSPARLYAAARAA